MNPDFLLIVNDLRNPRWREIVAGLESRVTEPDLEDQVRLGMDDVELMKRILGPVMGRAVQGKGPKDWVPVGKMVVGEAGLVILLDNVGRLETYGALKEEAWHEMVREAVTPTFYDVRGAFDKAYGEMVVNGRISESLWAPVYQRAGGDVIDRLLLQMNIRKTQNGWYEIMWNPWSSPITVDLVSRVEDIQETVARDLRRIWRQLLGIFWGFLEDDMKSAYPDQRMRYRPHWDAVVRARPEWVKAARREMVNLLERNAP